MTINLSVPNDTDSPELKPRIAVLGVGGAGGNAVNNMIQAKLEGVEFVAANTDAQALGQSGTDRRIQLGVTITRGLGAGCRPDIGRAAAEEAMEEIVDMLDGVNMVFVAAGMGGGTGTGAAPVVARAAREKGVLTVGVVTKPFQFEGMHRMRIAETGIAELEQYVDTLIVIPNQNLFRVANEKTTFADAFSMADEVLYSGVRGVTDLIVMPGLINLDFADIRSVMSEMGKAMMGTGEAEGERRSLDAAEAAISNPLLDDASMKGAKGMLINITGGSDMTLFEVDEAANRIRAEVDNDAYIIFGSTFAEDLDGRMRVSVVATGIESEASVRPSPATLNVFDRAESIENREEPDDDMVEEDAASAEPTPAANDETGEPVADETLPEEPAAADAPLDPTPIPSPRPVSAPEPAAPAIPAMGAKDVFIPPVPANPAPRPAPKAAEPFAAAAMVNGARPPEKVAVKGAPKSKGPSLFERVTGTGRAAKVPAMQAALSGESPRPPTTAEARPGVSQNKLSGLDPSDRIAGSRNEEDLLDIPAFLRRQAN